jgi:hypothetical protein
MVNIFNIPEEDFRVAMEEHNEHQTLVDCCDLIYKHGLLRMLNSLSDYCEDNKEAYALSMLSKMYKENESAFCKDAPTMQ